MPMTAFVGVRISWDILARKTALANTAACASTARCSARVVAAWRARFRSLSSSSLNFWA